MKSILLLLFLSSALQAQPIILRDPQIPSPASALRQNIVLDGTLAGASSRSQNFTVFIQITDADGANRSCTGIIVSEDLILTAGHCLPNANATAVVKFGRGGTVGFVAERSSTQYRAARPPQYSRASVSPWVNDYLAYNEASQQTTLSELGTRQELINFSEAPSYSGYPILLRDYALIKISSLPRGFGPVSFYEGTPSFRQKVYAAGFGLNSRNRSQLSTALRFSEHEIVGHYTPSNRDTLGLQLYSRTQNNFCLGDSGGPVFIDQDGTIKLIAINSFVINMCAEFGWAATVGSETFRIQIRRWAEELRGTISI